MLITSSAQDEASYQDDFLPEKFADFFLNKEVNIKNIIDFYQNYQLSTPHISGKYNDKIYFKYKTVKDAYAEIVQNEGDNDSVIKEPIAENQPIIINPEENIDKFVSSEEVVSNAENNTNFEKNEMVDLIGDY